MRKKVAVILCALCVTLAFVGCGKKQKETKTTETNVTTTEDHTLFIWIIVLACIAALTATGFLTLKKRKEE